MSDGEKIRTPKQKAGDAEDLKALRRAVDYSQRLTVRGTGVAWANKEREKKAAANYEKLARKEMPPLIKDWVEQNEAFRNMLPEERIGAAKILVEVGKITSITVPLSEGTVFKLAIISKSDLPAYKKFQIWFNENVLLPVADWMVARSVKSAAKEGSPGAWALQLTAQARVEHRQKLKEAGGELQKVSEGKMPQWLSQLVAENKVIVRLTPDEWHGAAVALRELNAFSQTVYGRGLDSPEVRALYGVRVEDLPVTMRMNMWVTNNVLMPLSNWLIEREQKKREQEK